MKKILAITLACLMVFTFVLSISAADVVPSNPEVNVKVETNEAAKVTNVTVNWTSAEFTYVYNRTWNPTELEDDISGGWKTSADATLTESKTATLTITNKSNKDVKVEATYAADETNKDELAGVNVTLTELNTTLKSADGNTDNTTAEATLTVSGKPTEESRDTMKIGTISISVRDAE